MKETISLRNVFCTCGNRTLIPGDHCGICMGFVKDNAQVKKEPLNSDYFEALELYLKKPHVAA